MKIYAAGHCFMVEDAALCGLFERHDACEDVTLKTGSIDDLDRRDQAQLRAFLEDALGERA